MSEGIAPRRMRRKRRARRRVLAAMAMSTGALLAVAIAPPVPRLMWNGSASAALGLYRIEAADVLGRGDLVLVLPPSSARELAVARGYLPEGVPLVKRVAGVAGDEVCAAAGRLHVNGARVAEALAQDSVGRPLVAWDGCRLLERGELVVLMHDAPGSFDSRYFGPVRQADVIGRVVPLWTW